ncbi:VanZ family protein [Streptomyces sp. NBC_01465]|uniref:VanZ family protein n=1 Tax=Streptomyces sp. NBC_01465 TaxID=2903878 RepID=UPI002E325BB2|nr:VanZ family protein [Streptomyces sp. NBC_01465]
MWEIIFWLNFATVAGFLLLCAVSAWVAAAVEPRTADVVPVLSRLLLACCTVVVLAATLIPSQPIGSGGQRYVSWVPGEGLWGDDLSTIGMGSAEPEMILRLQLANALMFVPLGLLLVFVTRRPRLGRTVLICLALSVLIEAAQYAMNAGRTVDVDDVLFNTLGGVVGGALAYPPRRAYLAEPSVRPQG